MAKSGAEKTATEALEAFDDKQSIAEPNPDSANPVVSLRGSPLYTVGLRLQAAKTVDQLQDAAKDLLWVAYTQNASIPAEVSSGLQAVAQGREVKGFVTAALDFLASLK